MLRKIALAFCLLAAPALAQPTHFVAAAIRNTGHGWHVITNDDHQPEGVSGVEAIGDSIVVHFDFKARAIGTFIVTPDETYAKMGFVCGASVNLDSATIQCSRWRWYGSHVVDPATMTAPMGDLWISGAFY